MLNYLTCLFQPVAAQSFMPPAVTEMVRSSVCAIHHVSLGAVEL
uniref:Uncharacterized protein n=1 Tax=Methylophaga nitratireducenticrescens TaxID=754476 RepID=I1XLV7_METNJ